LRGVCLGGGGGRVRGGGGGRGRGGGGVVVGPLRNFWFAGVRTYLSLQAL